MEKITKIHDGKLYKLKRPIGIGTNCVTGPGLIIGGALREGIRRAKLQLDDVAKDIECIDDSITSERKDR